MRRSLTIGTTTFRFGGRLPVDDKAERSQVEEVFGLTGGELADAPLRYFGATDVGPNRDPLPTHRWWARYWYEGRPDYLPTSHRGSWITLVECELYGSLPSRIQAHGRKWRKIARYASSGETECPGRMDNGSDDLLKVDESDCADDSECCTYCDEEIGEPHGYIYLGDGWGETIYYSRD